MKILLDTGIFIHSEFAQDAVKPRTVNWGATQTVSVDRFIRKKPHEDTENQNQKDALFTIDRLIREGRIQAYDYIEIRFERMRGRARVGMRSQSGLLAPCRFCGAQLKMTRGRRADADNIEPNAIALLSNYKKSPLDPPALWLVQTRKVLHDMEQVCLRAFKPTFGANDVEDACLAKARSDLTTPAFGE
jgi:hypothetical protein